MRIELPIINEPGAGLTVGADLTSGEIEKILIATGCGDTFILEELYKKLEHDELQDLDKEKPIYGSIYINDITGAKTGMIKALPLPGHTLIDLPAIVMKGYPAYKIDLVFGTKILSSNRWVSMNHSAGLVVISDEESDWQK